MPSPYDIEALKSREETPSLNPSKLKETRAHLCGDNAVSAQSVATPGELRANLAVSRHLGKKALVSHKRAEAKIKDLETLLAGKDREIDSLKASESARASIEEMKELEEHVVQVVLKADNVRDLLFVVPFPLQTVRYIRLLESF